jgi:sugar/nucleoside kinase (ribokinase family)
MSRVVVAGVVNVRAARRFESFPIPFVASSHEPDSISIRLSGTGWTVARTLQRLGTDVTFATYVGADELGQFATAGLLRFGLYGPATLVCGSQPRAMVLFDRHGRRAGTTDLRSTPDLRYPVDTFVAALDADVDPDAVVLTNIGFTRTLIPVVVDRGIPIATDLHLVETVDSTYNRDWMRVARILACSHEQLRGTPEGWIRAVWQRFGTEIVLVGCGADGAVLGVRAAREMWHVRAATPRGVRYTSGAGDTLLASFVHHHIALGDPVEAVRRAVLCAGWKVGASPDDEPGIAHERLELLASVYGLPISVRLA